MATLSPIPALPSPATLVGTAVPHNAAGFLDRRSDGRPRLGRRAGLSLGLACPSPAKQLCDEDELMLALDAGPLQQPPRIRHDHDHDHDHEHQHRGRRGAADAAADRLRFAMHDFVKATVWANHDVLRLRPSSVPCADQPGPAGKAVFVDSGDRPLPPWLRPTGGEHLHVHADGGAHMVLSPADAATARARGWAAAAAAVRVGCDEDGSGHPPAQYVTVRPPRGAAELGDWKRLVLASVCFCTQTAPGATAVRRPERL